MNRYRLIDTAGSELGVIDDERQSIDEGDTVMLDGRALEVVEIYDDETGREGSVAATLVVDD